MAFNLHPVRDFFNRVFPIDPPPGPKPRRPNRLVLVDANVFIYALNGDQRCQQVLDRLADQGRLATTQAIAREVGFTATPPWNLQLLTPGRPDPIFDQDVGNGKVASEADLSLLQAAIEYPTESILSYDTDLLWRAVTGPIQVRTGHRVKVLRAHEYAAARQVPRHNPTTYVMPGQGTLGVGG